MCCCDAADWMPFSIVSLTVQFVGRGAWPACYADERFLSSKNRLALSLSLIQESS